MANAKYWCQGCDETHGAAFWYFRPTGTPAQWWYVCRERYNTMIDKTGWQPLDEAAMDREALAALAALQGPQGTTKSRGGRGRRKVGRTTARRNSPRNRR